MKLFGDYGLIFKMKVQAQVFGRLMDTGNTPFSWLQCVPLFAIKGDGKEGCGLHADNPVLVFHSLAEGVGSLSLVALLNLKLKPGLDK